MASRAALAASSPSALRTTRTVPVPPMLAASACAAVSVSVLPEPTVGAVKLTIAPPLFTSVMFTLVAVKALTLKVEPLVPLTITLPVPLTVAPSACAALIVKVALFAKVTLIVPPPSVEALTSTDSPSIVTPFRPTLSDAPEAEVSTVVMLPSWLRLTVRAMFSATSSSPRFENASPVPDISTVLSPSESITIFDVLSPVMVPVKPTNCSPVIVTKETDPASAVRFSIPDNVVMPEISTVPTK